MEKILNPYDKEYMKMAMLKHEEMFREQVFELHRLYQIQKTLMKNMSAGQNKQSERKFDQYISFSDDMNQPLKQELDLEQSADHEKIEGIEIQDESEIELTLGPSNYNPRRKAAETPRTSDSGLSFSSSSTSSSRIKKTNSKIQRMTDRRKEELTAQKWGLVEVSNPNPSFLSGRRKSSDMEQDRLQQHPSWMFQVLSLNMT